MKTFFSLIILGMVSLAGCEVLTETRIEDIITTAYEGKSYLSLDGSEYQISAMNMAKQNLKDENKEVKHVLNYYTLACIFYSTYAVGNVKTTEEGNFTLDGWDNMDNWIFDVDYCSWFGIRCSLSYETEEEIAESLRDELVLEIELYNNTLYGTWPKEVGLIGDHLVTIDLFNNFYLHAEEYSWFQDMNALQYLFFGTTSWEADGIPLEFNQLTELIQFDCSYTFWSEGPIRGGAFQDLVNLEYVDIGDNIYMATEEIPNGMRQLPSLIRLYMDNVRFIDENRDDVTFSMDFLSDMTGIVEAWFDFTKFEGSLPTLPSSLKSFSALYCDLNGDIEELVNPLINLNRFWLTGNALAGDIPENIGEVNNDLQIAYLEGNLFNPQPMPDSLCNLLNTGNLQYLGGGALQCDDDSCCTCSDFECGNMPDPTPAPTVEGDSGFTICFSGSSTVEVENKGAVRMDDLTIGDVVKVAHDKFEPIYSFGHKDSTGSAEFLEITTEGSRKPLEISADHMVTIEGGRMVPASIVKNGDMLLSSSNELVPVTSIKKVVRTGAFAPFTASGSIAVNGIVASNYIAYQGSENLKIGGIESPFSYQWIAHTFNSVHRLAVMMGITNESYSETGVSQWVDVPHQMFSWVVEQNLAVSAILISLVLPLFAFARLIEVLVSSPLAIASIVGGISFLAHKKTYIKKRV